MAKNSLSYHDRFTRSLMTNQKVIEEFFHKNLPAHVREIIDLSSIQLQKETHISEQQTLFSPYHLIDLTQNSDEELREFLWYGPMARVLKHIHDVNILPSFKDILPELKVIEAHGEVGYINSVLTYVVGLAQTPHQEDLYETIKELGTVNEEKLMTLADYLKPKVYNRGIEKGEEKRNLEIARNMLAKGMDIDLIASVTELSSQEIKGLVH
jgi:predicted transposase YdaD